MWRCGGGFNSHFANFPALCLYAPPELLRCEQHAQNPPKTPNIISPHNPRVSSALGLLLVRHILTSTSKGGENTKTKILISLIGIIAISLLLLAPTFATLLYPKTKLYPASYSVNAANPVDFTLTNSTGANITSINFGQVAPGVLTPYTCTLSSAVNQTVWVSWASSALPSGTQIFGYWNGPIEMWNASTSRQWNTCDSVELIFALYVPVNTPTSASNSFTLSITDSYSP